MLGRRIRKDMTYEFHVDQKRLGGKRGAGVAGYEVRGLGVRGPGVWKTRGVENVWWKTRALSGKLGV